MYGEGPANSSMIIMLVAAMLFLFVLGGGAESLINAIKKKWNGSSYTTKRIITWISIPFYVFIVIYAFIPRE